MRNRNGIYRVYICIIWGSRPLQEVERCIWPLRARNGAQECARYACCNIVYVCISWTPDRLFDSACVHTYVYYGKKRWIGAGSNASSGRKCSCGKRGEHTRRPSRRIRRMDRLWLYWLAPKATPYIANPWLSCTCISVMYTLCKCAVGCNFNCYIPLL